MNGMKLALEIVKKYKEELMAGYNYSIESKKVAEADGNQQWLETAEYNAEHSIIKATCCREVIERLEQAMVVVEFYEKEKQEDE